MGGAAHANRFLELIRGDHTSDSTFIKASNLAKHLGKEASFVRKDVPGLLSIALAMPCTARPHTGGSRSGRCGNDRSFMPQRLWPVGGNVRPFRWMDITGGPELYAKSIERVLPTLCSENEKLPELLERLKQEAAGGQLTGSGFYEYSSDSPNWQERYEEFAWHARALLDEFYPLENEQDMR